MRYCKTFIGCFFKMFSRKLSGVPGVWGIIRGLHALQSPFVNVFVMTHAAWAQSFKITPKIGVNICASMQWSDPESWKSQLLHFSIQAFFTLLRPHCIRFSSHATKCSTNVHRITPEREKFQHSFWGILWSLPGVFTPGPAGAGKEQRKKWFFPAIHFLIWSSKFLLNRQVWRRSELLYDVQYWAPNHFIL